MQICRGGCGGGVFFLGSGFWGVLGLVSDVAAGAAFPLLLRLLEILLKNSLIEGFFWDPSGAKYGDGASAWPLRPVLFVRFNNLHVGVVSFLEVVRVQLSGYCRL